MALKHPPAQVMLVAHSLGDAVVRHFMVWVEELSPGWVERHLAVYANIAGPTLGAPVAIPALLTGASTLACSVRDAGS